MIVVALGTQDFQFDRLLKALDELVGEGAITEPVFAQTGYSTYAPKNYETAAFLSFEEFDQLLEKCSLLIAHGGTGTLVGGLKKGKRIIAVPRQCRYGEHVDDHQQEIIGVFADSGMVLKVDEMDELKAAIEAVASFEPRPFVSGRDGIVRLLEGFIAQM